MEVWLTTPGQRQKTKYRQQLPGILLETGLILGICGAGILLLLEMLTGSADRLPFLCSVFFTALVCFFTGTMGKGRQIMGILLFVLAGACVFYFCRFLLAGAVLFWNKGADLLGNSAGIYLVRYQAITDIDSDLAVMVFLGMAAGVAGYLLFRWRISLLLVLLGLVPAVVMVVTGSFPVRSLFIVFYFTLVLGLIRMHTDKGTVMQTWIWGEGILYLAAVALAAGLILVRMLPQEEYQDLKVVSDAKEKAGEALYDLRYKKGQTGGLTGGNLKNTGNMASSEETVLKVSMEELQPMYLRGFVGSRYDGSSWKSTDFASAYEERNLFYWLHQKGFYGETQLASGAGLTDTGMKSQKVHVENLAADSRYLYTPYEMQQLPDGHEGEDGFADSTVGAKGFFGERDYFFTAVQPLTSQFTDLGAQVYQLLASGKDTDYRQAESYYNAFVYANDTQLPAALESLFKQELGEAGDRSEGHTDYYTAITRIRTYLEKHMTYSSAPDPYSGSGDFTREFLEDKKIGCDVHFATAAALMFRYYGIPSRHVEGYLVTPADIQDKKSGETLDIPGKNGHAWTEIYIDGLGWVPVEMTPEYYGVMDEADLKTGLEAKGRQAKAVPEEAQTEQEEENIQTHWSLQLALFGIEKFFLLFLAVFDAFCVVFILTVVMLRIQALYMRRKRFSNKDEKKALCAMAGYAQDLYSKGEAGYSKEAEELYQQVYQAGQKAAFSPHSIQFKEQEACRECIRILKKELKKQNNWFENWVMKYIERLY